MKEYDVMTQRYLAASDKLLNYEANCKKMWDMHCNASKTRLILGGKRCLPLDYKVLRADGEWTTIGDVQVGDEILGVALESGVAVPTKVISKNYSGVKKLYRIELTDGTSCRASLEHQFPVFSRSGSKNSHGKKSKPITYTVENLLKTLENSDSKKKGLVQAREVNFSNSEKLEIHPYLLGALLGDGGFPKDSSLTFTNIDEEVISRVSSLIANEDCEFHRSRDITWRIVSREIKHRSNGTRINPLKDKLRSLGLIGHGKFVPKKYLISSVENRKQLLAGLIDTDGCIDGFTSKYKELAEGFCFIVKSLGGKATLTESFKTCYNTGAVGKYWQVYWRLNCELPLSLKYKNPLRGLNINYCRRVINDIKELEEVETANITVDHPDHNFIGENWIVTGNSGKSTFGCVETCWAALGIHPFLDYPKPPLKIRVCGVSFQTIQKVLLPMFYEWLPRHAIKKYWIERSTLELTNGSFIEFLSYEQEVEKYEGTERHLIWCDEEPPREKYESNFMRTISSGINGKLLITCTPLHGLNWIYDELYDNPAAVPPAVSYTTVSIYDNPHLTREAIEEIKKNPAMQDSLDSVMFGLFIPKVGLVYKNFSDKNIIPPIAKPEADWLLVTGLDLHDRNPHGVVFMGLNKDDAWIVYDEIHEWCIIKDLVDKIKAKLGDRFPAPINIADTSLNTPQSISGMSEAQELYYKYHFNIVEAHKDVQSGILKVSSLLYPGEGQKPKLYITENCVQTIREFKHYTWQEWTRNKDKYDPKEKPRKKDDHLVDAIRYVAMANIKYRPPGWKYERKEPKRVSSITGYY